MELYYEAILRLHPERLGMKRLIDRMLSKVMLRMALDCSETPSIFYRLANEDKGPSTLYR